MYLKVLEYFRKVRQQNALLLKSLRALKERVEFLETLALNVPEFNQAFERIQIDEQSELSKVKKIVKIVCDYYNVNSHMILQSKTNKRDIAELRQVIHYLCRKYTELSLSVIGVHVGGKNHTTVLYSEKVVNNRLSYDKKFISDMDEIKKQVRKSLKKKPKEEVNET